MSEVQCPSQLPLWRQISASMGISLHSVQSNFAVVLIRFCLLIHNSRSLFFIALFSFFLIAGFFLGMSPLFKGARASDAEVVWDLNIYAMGVIPGGQQGQ